MRLICAMTAGVAGAAIAAAALAGATSSARAEVEYPWCAEMHMGRSGPVQSCGFRSQAQCENYINGIGGYCEPNLRYRARPEPRRRTRHSYER